MKEAALALLGGGLALASLTVWIVILVRRSVGYPIVPFEPRREVPWRLVDVLLVLVGFLFFAILAPLVVAGVFGLPRIDGGQPPELDALNDWTPLLVADGLAKIATIALAVLFGVSRGGATAVDFGLTLRNIVGDLKLGALGFLAALLPVYCVQAVVIQVMPPDKQHPVLEMLSERSGTAALAVAVLFAVVLAPLAEEFLFRAFLQGWLETRPWRSASASGMGADTASSPNGHFSSRSTTDVKPIENESHWHEIAMASAENPYAPPTSLGIPSTAPLPDSSDGDLPSETNRAPARSDFVAIVISSFVFAVLHASNWPAPVPLFFLALILGYLYNRTHRLLPCIVVHLLFNALSVAAVMWGMATG